MSGSFNVLFAILTFSQGYYCSIKPRNRQPNIVIIGAGLAGLSAADRLINDHNFRNVKIIEATRYIGGRVRPVFYPGSGLQNIVLGKSVRLVDYSSSRVRLILSDDTQLYADHVMVTSSLGYLKRNAAFMFRPPLPMEKRVTIQKMGFGTIDKLYLIFEKPFWSHNLQTLNLLRIENDPWNCRTHFYAQRNETELENIFWRFSVHPYIKNVISAVIVGDFDPAKTRWALDPFFLGSIAYMSMDCEKDSNCDPRILAIP
uniref:Amine oxidase domain-containing protein n=1 Tax=Romanomermis culicivorax TaxID=13658 RepID=A0A915J463_ROMCU